MAKNNLLMSDSLLILKTGSKLPALSHIPGDFEDWIAQGLRPFERTCSTLDAINSELPSLDGLVGIVITGSGAMVTDSLPWVEHAATWLRDAVSQQIPTLGICFGHQLLAYALGGEVDWNPKGVEVGTVNIHLTPAAQQDPLFQTTPGHFAANASHRQSVITLPAGATQLALSDMDRHHAFRFGLNTWGVQFHPEFDVDITAAYIQFYHDALASSGRDSSLLAKQLTPTPVSHTLLHRFATICLGNAV